MQAETPAINEPLKAAKKPKAAKKTVPAKPVNEAKEYGKKRHEAAKTATTRNSSIITEGEVIQTIAGPICGWKPCPENLPNHPTMAYFGKRRTGKSTSITNVLFHCCQNIPFGIVMSDTAYAGYWDKLVPERHIVQGLRQDVLDWLIQRQMWAVETYGVKG